MKFIYTIVSIIIFSVTGSIYASTLSGDLLEIQDKIGTGYTNGYVDWIDGRIQSYNTQLLEEDIKKDVSDFNQWTTNTFNNIQIASKSKKWNKERFLSFLILMKKKETKKAAVLVEKYWNTLDPFHARGDFIWIPISVFAVKWLKNGIISITGGWQDTLLSFQLNYTFLVGDTFYNIQKNITGLSAYFDNWIQLLFQCPNTIDSFENIESLTNKLKKDKCTIIFDSRNQHDSRIISLDSLKLMLIYPKNNTKFQNIYNQFVSDMSKIWK